MSGSFHELADAFNLPGASDQVPRNVLLLADNSHPANVVQDHIRAFRTESRHLVRVINPIHEELPTAASWHELDAILVHYSLFVLSDYYLPRAHADFLRSFPGPKLQIIQDEHRHINRMKARQAELGFSAVFSSLSCENLHLVYAGATDRKVYFFSCLPGYVSRRLHELNPSPIAERTLHIVYRGRDLPFWLGRAGQEKRHIGEQVRQMAAAHGLKVDIDSSEDSRIYGDAWMEFLMSGRATIGVEGGSSIFDFDEAAERGVSRYLAEHPRAEFEEVFEHVLAPLEGNVVHRTITPRIFESIASKTALVLYPGSYRGVLEPERHYIVLHPDGSNSSQVVAMLRDAGSLQALVDRAHREVLNRPELSAAYYVRAIDSTISSLCATTRATVRVKRAWDRALPRRAMERMKHTIWPKRFRSLPHNFENRQYPNPENVRGPRAVLRWLWRRFLSESVRGDFWRSVRAMRQRLGRNEGS